MILAGVGALQKNSDGTQEPSKMINIIILEFGMLNVTFPLHAGALGTQKGILPHSVLDDVPMQTKFKAKH